MSRILTRGLVASIAATAVLAASLLGVQSATAGAGAVTGLVGKPNPPEKILLQWDEYTGFVTDHYVAVIQPGDRTKVIDASATSANFGDLSWGQNYTATVRAVDATGTESEVGTLDLPGTKLMAEIAKHRATKGTKVGITGQLRWSNDKPIRRKNVHIQVAYAPNPPYVYENVKKAKTNKRGKYSTTVRAKKNATYRVLFKKRNTAGGWDGSLFLKVVK